MVSTLCCRYRIVQEVLHTFANTQQSVFLDRSLPLEVRYLAVIQLKNGIDKYWRKTATKYAPKRTCLLILPNKFTVL